MNRSQQIIRTSIVSIIANVLLAAFKAVVGLLAHSVAIVMDAVNNLTDVFSSVVTIIGTRLSQRPPDLKHPFGHGRIEYFSAIVISVIVLSAGITSLIESAIKIIHPNTPTYSKVTLIVIIVLIVHTIPHSPPRYCAQERPSNHRQHLLLTLNKDFKDLKDSKDLKSQ